MTRTIRVYNKKGFIRVFGNVSSFEKKVFNPFFYKKEYKLVRVKMIRSTRTKNRAIVSDILKRTWIEKEPKDYRDPLKYNKTNGWLTW